MLLLALVLICLIKMSQTFAMLFLLIKLSFSQQHYWVYFITLRDFTDMETGSESSNNISEVKDKSQSPSHHVPFSLKKRKKSLTSYALIAYP